MYNAGNVLFISVFSSFIEHELVVRVIGGVGLGPAPPLGLVLLQQGPSRL